jgi:hypothetical protein
LGSGRFDGRRRRSRRRSDRCWWLGNFEGGRKFYRDGRLDWFWLGRRRSWGRGLLHGRGRSCGGEAGFDFVNAGFEFVQVFEAGFEFVEGFDDAGKTLVVLLAADAGLHPTIEGPHGKDEDPKLHGTSGPGSAGHVVDRESLQGVGLGETNCARCGGGVITEG